MMKNLIFHTSHHMMFNCSDIIRDIPYLPLNSIYLGAQAFFHLITQLFKPEIIFIESIEGSSRFLKVNRLSCEIEKNELSYKSKNIVK